VDRQQDDLDQIFDVRGGNAPAAASDHLSHPWCEVAQEAKIRIGVS
jgi:hypothetical protein